LKRFGDSSDPGVAGRVKSIKVLSNWDPNAGGILDKTRMTYHSTPFPTDQNVIGRPVTVTRPLTVVNHAPPYDKTSAEQGVRDAHARMAADPNHRFATANHATVHDGWHTSWPDASGMHREISVGFTHVSQDERTIRCLGDINIRQGHEPAGGPPSNACAWTHAGPSEMPRSAHSNQISISPPHDYSSSSESSHHDPPGSHSDSEATSRFRPPKRQRTN
jgi:hypothetical protein